MRWFWIMARLVQHQVGMWPLVKFKLILVRACSCLRLITTSAVSGNGGAISILGSGLMLLKQGQVSTSVSGLENGNGGEHQRHGTCAAVTKERQFKANTAAAKASGGDVGIHVNDIPAAAIA